MRRLPFLLVGLTLPVAAFAEDGDFHHTGWVWAPEDQPVTWYMQEVQEDSLPNSVNPDNGLLYQEEVMIKSYCNWKWIDYCDEVLGNEWVQYDDASCADISFEYLGLDAGNEGATFDYIRKVYWDDPAETVGTGTLGVTYTIPSSTVVKSLGDESYVAAQDSDIVFNDNISWETTEDVAAGNCSGGTSIEAVATHEVGHLWGMAHTCEQDEICLDTAHLEATMYWSAGPCDIAPASLNAEDMSNFESLYGAYVGVDQSPESAFGAAPLDVDFELDIEESITLTEVFWRYGDGEEATVTSADWAPPHTYTTQGQFTPSAEVTGSTDECGEFTSKWSNLASVLVCTVPEPVFAAEPHQGLTWQMVNLTDVTTYGCIDGVTWIVQHGGTEVARVGAWSPKIEFPEAGDYTIVLEVEGPAGGGAAELSVTITDAAGGCSTVPVGGFGLAGLLLGLGAVVRRRR